ncbi:NAD-dependent epimerase/dehydratase family protein [Clostridium saccharoperbutylacetonicum]|uniref:NAD-dependent epimerase/dehydratase family protein n=1 Tax=Clostridium saccharoperbutylacetonicum TaxID=36745 RepID=UPI0039EAA0D0
MKKVIITGISGFIGKYLGEYYISGNYKVIGIGRNKYNIDSENYEFVKLDLNKDNLEKVWVKYKPDYFIHCASNASVSESITNPLDDFESSVSILYKILFSLKNVNLSPKFIYLSSAAVYGNPKKLPVTECDETNPISPYGLNKKLCENICEYFIKNESMDIKILRIFSVYGAGLTKQILWDISKKVKNSDKIELFGNGNETRDFINIRDLIRTINLILESTTEDYIFNIANGEEISIRELAQIYLENNNINIKFLTFNNIVNEGNPNNWVADITRLKKIGYRKEIEINQGIKEYIEWLNSNYI